MPISRPLLIALVLAVVAVAGFYATQGSRSSTDSAAPVVPVEPAPQPVEDDVADAPRKAARPEGVPRAVQRALRADRRVVLFFFEPGSADDRATAQGVAALRGRRGVAVFTDPISRLARYRGLIGDLGISQAPAVVIVGRDREARVIEGYVDPASLAQDVADTR